MLKEKQLGLTSTEFKEYLMSIIGNSPYGIFTIDLQGYVTMSNQLAAKFLSTGLEAEQFVDNLILENISHIKKLHDVFAKILYGQRSDFDLPEINVNDKVLEIKGRKILNGMLITIIDITEQVKTTRELNNYTNELQKVNSDLEEFNYISAHDLKSPIATISGLVDLLEENELPEDSLEIINMLKNTVACTSRKLEALNRVLAHKKELHLEPEFCSLNSALEEVKNLLAGEIKNSGAKIICDFSVEHVNFPRVHLITIMQNMIDNAIKYCSPETKPEIIISSGTDKKYDRLIFRDNGIGIDLGRYGDKIFKLFYRISDKKENGSGVGLHIVKNIVTSYNGYLEVESAPGDGTIMKVYMEKKDVTA